LVLPRKFFYFRFSERPVTGRLNGLLLSPTITFAQGEPDVIPRRLH